jgi:predicted metal-dependent phosphotriesterase family hydrolase
VAVVETVRGPVDLGNLGQTLMHEHLFVLSTEHVQNYGSDWWDEEAMVARAIARTHLETGAPITVHTSGPHQTGHDANCFIDYFGAAHDAARAAAAPNWHYEHITDDVLPALLASGVTQEQIDTMMVENPVRYFTRGGTS